MSADVVDALDTIISAITPYIGENMARSAARVHCEKLGINGPTLSAQQVKALVDRLESGLHVFVGRDKALALMKDLRQTLAVTA